MCGIAGIFYHNPSVDLSDVMRQMCAALRHRGPDDQGIFQYENVALGMQRLSIIDLKGGHQPIFSDDKRFCIVYNGELYNYLPLRQELAQEGVRFHTQSDTEVILKAYIKYGKECLQLFNGMFAFAIFDKKEKEFFIARDRMGVKPLYYSFLKGRGFAFASEIKALLRLSDLDKTIDTVALNQFFVFEYIPEPRSIFQEVKKLPSANYLIFNPSRNSEIKPYWELDPQVAEKQNFEQAKQELQGLIQSAVNYRLVSDVPVGLFLSGGIDSSIIACEMSRAAKDTRPSSFSVGFEQKSYDECPFAQQVAAHCNFSHQYQILSQNRMLSLLPEIFQHLDEPLADASFIPTFLLSQFTRQYVKVALSGDGGDELFLGYDTHRAHKIAKIFRWMPPWMLSLFQNTAGYLPPSDKNVSLEFKIKKFFSALGSPSDVANILWWGAYPPQQLASLMPNKRVSFDEIFEPVLRYREKLKGLDLLKQISFLDIHLYLKDDLLVKVDRASMAHSLEVRNPFMDYRLAELAMRLPSSWKLKGQTGKFILRDMYKNHLPAPIVKRKKKGFDIPLTPWLRKDLSFLTDELLSNDYLKDQDFFSRSFVDTIIQEHRQQKANHRQLLWPLLTFQMWYKNFLQDR